MSDDRSAPAPLSERTAIAVLGSMLLLILTLTILLVESTWADVRVSAQLSPPTQSGSIAQR